MRKLWITAVFLLILTAAITPVMAMEYDIGTPSEGLFGTPTSVEPVIVVGAGPTEQSNIDRSKNTALIPPPFGSMEASQTGTGIALIPQTQSGTSAAGSNGSTAYYPPAESTSPATSTLFTLPDGLYYADGSLGRLKIPKLGVNIKVYETESMESLSKGAGHFKSTSCWDGNVGFAAHNRGASSYFGEIHTLKVGDKITYTTQLGSRTYEVFYVGQISETDFSRLGRSEENMVTLITCVRDVRNMRWCVQAREIR